MQGALFWLAVGLLAVVLATGARNEWQGIRYLMARLKGSDGGFSRASHRGVGKAAVFFACLWGVVFIASAPVMFRQFTPGFNALLMLGVMLMGLFTMLSGWLLKRRERKAVVIVHQMIGYVFVMLIAGVLMLLVEEHFFDAALPV